MFKLTLSFKDRALKVFYPSSGVMSIGRSPACDIHIDNLAVSPEHARLEFDDHRARIEVTAGEEVLVNDQPVTERSLEDGDRITVGKHIITISRDASQPAADEQAPSPATPLNGWIQFLSGPKLGRTVRLDRSMVRLGKSGQHSAMISNRRGSYYISHLEGEAPTRVGDTPIGEESVQLCDGDTIQIGDVKMLFFIESR